MMMELIPLATHEAMYRVTDADSGLIGFIAIHSTERGPAAGGLRMRPYPNEAAAIEDAARLSEGMTFKNAAADLPFGGGKSVIMGDPATDKTDALLIAFARAINSLHGQYFTAEDMGMTPADMAVMAQHSGFVGGLTDGEFASGDPSPITAKGIFNAIRVTARHRIGSDDLTHRRVAVQGLGNVGWALCELLRGAGCELTVADIDDARCRQAKDELGADIAPVDEIYSVEADIFAPCAIGGILNRKTIAQLKVGLVAGGANNQLATPQDAQRLHERGILYAPDFVANGGGIINVTTELLKISDRESFVAQKLRALEATMDAILTQAEKENTSPDAVAIKAVKHKMGQIAA